DISDTNDELLLRCLFNRCQAWQFTVPYVAILELKLCQKLQVSLIQAETTNKLSLHGNHSVYALNDFGSVDLDHDAVHRIVAKTCCCRFGGLPRFSFDLSAES